MARPLAPPARGGPVPRTELLSDVPADPTTLPGLARWQELAPGAEQEPARPRILIIDDQPANVVLLTRLLLRAGVPEVEYTTEPRDALALFRKWDPDLVLLDLHMPDLDGMAVLLQLRAAVRPGEFVPIVIITGDSDSAQRRATLANGATDFLLKPFDLPEVLLRIRNALETRLLHLMLQRQNADLEAQVLLRTRELAEAQFEALERLAIAAEFRDDATGRHTQRVARVATLLAAGMALPPETVELIRRSAPLHDVGKIGVPDHILLKPGKLTPTEFEVMQTHSAIGAQILGGGHSRLMQTAERVARSHHEHWDGTGYPDHLAGEAIPVEARIIAVADVFDALTHRRPYRAAWSPADVTAEIVRLSERQFDPKVVDTLAQLDPAALTG